jgi:cytochrome c553
MRLGGKGAESESQIMKFSRKKLALLTAILAVAFSATGRGEDVSQAGTSRQSPLQAKVEYCTTCHGPAAQGYHGFYPIPRLAGQQTQYIENQLQAYIEHRRENKYMYSVAHVLSPAIRAALARHFSELNPQPLDRAPKGLAAAGKQIYENGIPETNVPACMACHGGGAKGQGAIPRLAGQLNDYIISKLQNWNRERGLDPARPDISAIMLPTSHNLTKAQVAAVAAYVSYLQ